MTGAGFLPVWTATMAAMMLPSSTPLLRLDCCAGLMAALVGLGVMSWIWMTPSVQPSCSRR